MASNPSFKENIYVAKSNSNLPCHIYMKIVMGCLIRVVRNLKKFFWQVERVKGVKETLPTIGSLLKNIIPKHFFKVKKEGSTETTLPLVIKGK